MEVDVFTAFRSIGIADPDAIAAAEALSKRDIDVYGLKADMVLMKGMLGFNIALSAAIMLKLLVH